MSRNNTKNSHIVKAKISSITTNSSNNTFEFEIKVYAKEKKDAIYKSSYDRLDRAYAPGKKIFFSSLIFYKRTAGIDTFLDVTNPNNLYMESNDTFTIKSIDFLDYNTSSNPYFKFKVDWTLTSSTFTALNNGFVFIDSLDHNASFTKPGALLPKYNSGILSKSIGKVKKNINNKFSRLPSSSKTSGKILQNFNQAFDDTNIIEFNTVTNTNSNVGLPLKNIYSNTSEKFYLSTNSSLLNSSVPILESDDIFREKFKLENTNIISLPHTFGTKNNHYESTRKITKDNIDNLLNSDYNSLNEIQINNDLVKERFIEKYTPFDESYYHYENKNSSFYKETIDSDFKDKNYSLGSQKQIKITLDFTNDVDLHLMNTKFSFVHPNRSTLKSNFDTSVNHRGERDRIVSTKFFNFVNETGNSYSSHFLPTAYWNFSNSKWNYLDNTDTILEDDPTTSDDESSFYHKNLFYGAFNSYNENINESFSNQIYNNFIFTGNNYDLGSVNLFYRDLYVNTLFNKPILTTPSYRINGSMLSNNVGTNYNKSMLCQITNSYGFPYKSNWQPQNDHLLDMSKYISNDFLVEKVLIKGKLSSNGELPVKKGNFYSGYIKRSFTSNISNKSYFDGSNSSYNFKDGVDSKCIANNLTFFILNERKNINYFKKDIIIDPIQFYTYLRDGSSTVESTVNKDKLLSVQSVENFLGDFKSYENYNNTLKLKSYISDFNKVYTLDAYNNLINNVPSIYEGGLILSNFSKGTFLSLTDKENITESDVDFVENFYYDNKNEWSDSNFNQNLASGDTFLKYRIKKDYTVTPDNNTSRELVTFSNLLITKKKDSATIDNEVLKNIDEHISYSVPDNEDLHLNLGHTSPIDFEIKSLCKNQVASKHYLDESEYKIKSNYYEEVEIIPEETSTVDFKISRISNNANSNDFFQFEASSTTTLKKILGSEALTNSGNIPTSLGTLTTPAPLFALFFKFTKSNKTYTSECRFQFSYKDPSGLSNYSNYNNEKSINLSNFITYSTLDIDPLDNPLNLSGNQVKNINIIDLNLRIFDCWNNAVIDYNSFFNLGKKASETYNMSNFTTSGLNIPVNTKSSANSILALTDSDKLTLLRNLIAYAFVLKKVITGSNYQGYRSGVGLLESSSNNFSTEYTDFMTDVGNNNFTTPEDGLARFSFLRSKFDPYVSTSLSSTTINKNIASSSSLISTFFSFDFQNNYKGNLKVTGDEDYYNASYVLEGKNRGEPNGVGLKSERVIDSKLVNSGRIPLAKTNSGKYINSGENINSTVNSTYLLKPEDNLVFGVTSYCNGQVMPTVFKLHDKIEITLIGRDYTDISKQRSNLSSGISKVIIGDNTVVKSSKNLNQATGSYYDNVWNKSSSLNNSLAVFKQNKEVINQKSLKSNAGQVTDFFTFENQKIDNKNIFKKDSLNLSIANVYKNILNKELNDNQLLTSNLKTNLNALREKPDSTLNEERDNRSYKIIITESKTSANIDTNWSGSFPNLGSKYVIDDWHKKYHLKEYSFFTDEVNILENDISLGHVSTPEKGIDIHFDISSYTSRINDVLYHKIYGLSEEYIDFDGSYTIPADTIKNFYKSIESFTLPASTQKNFQYPVEIQNIENFQSINPETGSLENKSFINSNYNIDTKVDNNKTLISNASLQYFSSNMHLPEYLSDFEDYSRHYRGTNNLVTTGLYYSPMWHLVLETSIDEFKSIKLNFEGEEKIVENSYIDLFLFQSNDFNVSHLKTFKVVKIDEENDYVQLATPLYFWETLEVDDNFIKSSTNSYARIQTSSNIYSSSNRPLASDPIWYASLSSTEKQIKKTSKIYNPFVASSYYNQYSSYSASPETFVLPVEIVSSSGLITTLPYTKSALQALKGGNQTNLPDVMIDSLIFDVNFYVSPCSFKTQNNNINPVYTLEDSVTKNFNNNFKLKENSLFFTNRLYLENNTTLIENRNNNRLEKRENLLSHFINEKIYRSPVYKKVENYFAKTKFDLIYKIKNINANFGSSFEFDKFKLIEVIEFVNSNKVFEKEFFTLNQPNYSLNNNDVIRIYEDNIYKNFFLDEKQDVPYFEIDLSQNSQDISRTTQSPGGTVTKSIKIIPYTYNKIPESNSEQLLSYLFSSNLGTPIFEIKKTPSGYNDITLQENKIKSFFYGFSRRSKYRYPLFNLDGFKYGVENSTASTNKFYYSNNSYGMFKDKIMGSKNYCTIYRGKNNINVANQTVEKKFVDSYFKYIDMEAESVQTTTTFNKDKYARSTYPFIENSEDQLSGYYVS